jgi:periplasmic divalent cation tolerance protein
MPDTIFIGWTTVDSESAAQQLAHGLVESGLAGCVQITASVTSVYRWEGAVQSDAEWRLMLKFPESQTEAIAAYLDAQHPYDTPQWVVVRAEHVAPALFKVRE